jgi:translation elongation factor EF-Ts
MVEVLPLESTEEGCKENYNDNDKTQQHPQQSRTKMIEDKFISKVAKIGENYNTRPTKPRSNRVRK